MPHDIQIQQTERFNYLLREAGFYGLLEKNPILASYPASSAGVPPARGLRRALHPVFRDPLDDPLDDPWDDPWADLWVETT